jgi:lipid A 4'-phosphatase
MPDCGAGLYNRDETVVNRTGLYIALILALLFGLLFGLYPELDLKVASYFYDATAKLFPLRTVWWAMILRDVAMWIAWGLVAPAIIALIVKLFRPVKPLMMSGRAMVFLLVTMLLSGIVLSNIIFKGYWGRPRPVTVTQFEGKLDFKPWWDPSGKCPRNCSFFSGEGATAFWTYAPAALAPPQWRPLAYVGATAFGITTGGLRMAFGGHFLTDVVFSGIAAFLTVWFAFAFIYRWPSTKLTDEGIDAGLTRFAWPGYRWMQKRFGRDVGNSPRVRAGAAE